MEQELRHRKMGVKRLAKWGMRFAAGAAMVLVCCFVMPLSVRAGTIYQSPYVSFSPDKKAFTTNAGDTNYQQFPKDFVVNGISGPRGASAGAGQHIFQSARTEDVPVGYWKVEHPRGYCCHDIYPSPAVGFHQIEMGRVRCFRDYFSGWMAYCADCGERITPMLVYMSREAAASITLLDTRMAYYYLCPYCKNFEQGADMTVHICKRVSWNRYQVHYESNSSSPVYGTMPNSIHMYNQADTYEGEAVQAQKRLSKNQFQREGYVFLGWNSRPDGLGQGFADEQEVWNLTQENYDGTGKGVVTLYAQWARQESTLQIDPAGGTYLGTNQISQFRKGYGEYYQVDMDSLVPPAGKTVSFDARGGSWVAPLSSAALFQEWSLRQPFAGVFRNYVYQYKGGMGAVDRITATYRQAPVVLPDSVRPGYSLKRWCYDPECTRPAGGPGESFTPDADVTLYADWTLDLALSANVERILEPHDPIFRCGESGRLTFRVAGYPDRVEVRFPRELTEWDAQLNKDYPYGALRPEAEEEIVFMVPLHAAKGEYEIVVTAYKDGVVLQEKPMLWTLGEEESILKEIRTRLR